jgi:hypothetical protein
MLTDSIAELACLRATHRQAKSAESQSSGCFHFLLCGQPFYLFVSLVSFCGYQLPSSGSETVCSESQRKNSHWAANSVIILVFISVHSWLNILRSFGVILFDNFVFAIGFDGY